MDDVVEVPDDDDDDDDWNFLGGVLAAHASAGYSPSEPVGSERGESHVLQPFDAFHASEPQLTDPACIDSGVTMESGPWRHSVAGDFNQFARVHNSLLLPWEQGVLKQIFEPDLPLALPATEMAPVETLLAPALEPSSGIEPSSELPVDACYTKAVQSLKDLEYFDQKRCQLALACAQWLEVLSNNWKCSSVGEQIAVELQYDSSGDSAISTLKAVFGVKSPATLLKRVSTVRKYIRWCNATYPPDHAEHELCCLPFKETTVWDYFNYLKAVQDMESKGYTAPSTFLETVRFCRFTLGFYLTDEILQSKPLLGFAAIQKRTKGPSRQAPALELEHLQRLHEVVNGSGNFDRQVGCSRYAHLHLWTCQVV